MEDKRFTFGLPWKVLVAGVLLSAAAAVAWQRGVRLQTERAAVEDAQAFEAGISVRVAAHLALLRGVAGLFAINPDVSREEFREYVTAVEIEKTYPGLQGIGFTARVRPADKADFIARIRRESWPDFSMWPAGLRSEYHAIVYLEPLDVRNRAALGYDMSSEATRRAAMHRARDTGAPAASGRVKLVQEILPDAQAGFLVYIPFYGGKTPSTPTERREQLAGFVYAPFRAGDFIRVVSEAIPAGAGVAIYSGLVVDEAQLLHRDWHLTPAQLNRVVTLVRQLQVVDQTWTIVYTRAIAGTLPWWALFGAGLVATGAAVLLLQRENRAVSRAEQSEATTREREGELALLVEAVPALVCYVDREQIVRLCNRRYEEWFGGNRHAVIGRPWHEMVPARLQREIAPMVERARRGEPVTFDRWYNGPDGARFLVSYLVPLRTMEGRWNGFYIVASDLTAHKQAEESARFVADCGKMLFSATDHEAAVPGLVHLAVPRIADVAVMFRAEGGQLRAIAVAHVDGEMERRLTDFLAKERFSMGSETNLGRAARTGMTTIIPAVSPPMLEVLGQGRQREMAQALDLVSAIHVPVVVRRQLWAVFSFATTRRSGRRFSDQDRGLAEEISTRVRLAVENALLYREAQQEIGERRRAERLTRETEERFRLLVEGARDYAIFLLDPDGRVASWNQGAERILGFTEKEALGMPVERMFSPEDVAAGVPGQELAQAREKGSAPDERWHVRKDGTRFWVSGHCVVLRNEDGAIRGYAKIMRDLTGWKLTEDELERRVQERTLELNEAVQELEAFSYSVSHDLRAPLRSIRGFTDLTLEEAGPRLTDDERSYLMRAQRAVTRLDELISDLLAYTKVAKTRIEREPVDVHALVGDLLREHPEFQLPRAETEIVGALPPVMGNVAYLTQCFTNLLGNAVKFVRPGVRPHVRISGERRGDLVRLAVQDNGIGIPPEHLSRVFEMFERIHVSAGYEGTGVGLAIVRRAVQRMHGRVGVESKLGEGTTFWIELPAA